MHSRAQRFVAGVGLPMEFRFLLHFMMMALAHVLFKVANSNFEPRYTDVAVLALLVNRICDDLIQAQVGIRNLRMAYDEFFFGKRTVPFSGSRHLSLTCGPAGNRTTTGSLSAGQKHCYTKWTTGTGPTMAYDEPRGQHEMLRDSWGQWGLIQNGWQS